jgi:hypothetical protein
MPTLAGTTSTYSVSSGGGNREDLEDVIYDLFPDDSWALTNLDKTKASATYHEWLGDQLAAVGANINVEGADATYSTSVAPARYGNYTQIFKKTFIISGTQEVVNKAGRRSEISRQAVKQMRELKNDVEYALVINQGGTAGAANTGRSLASMESWIGATSPSSTVATNVVLATSSIGTGNWPETASGTPAAPTDNGTSGAFVEASLRLALQAAWEDGGQADTILLGAAAKNSLNDFTSLATRNVDLGRTQQASITGAADLYVSNYGVHKVVMHRHVRTRVVLCLDTSMWAVAGLRGFQMESMAKTGDGEKRQLLYEGTLVCRNWRANSMIVGIAGT